MGRGDGGRWGEVMGAGGERRDAHFSPQQTELPFLLVKEVAQAAVNDVSRCYPPAPKIDSKGTNVVGVVLLISTL